MTEAAGQGGRMRKAKTEGQLPAGMKRCATDLGISMISNSPIIMVSSGSTAVRGAAIHILNSPIMP